jgi:hypothetical protein
MSEIQETNTCGRAEQLVGYLYGEATADERAVFEQHLSACVACRDELAAFRMVRAAVGEWRAEVLQNAPTLALSEVTGQAAHAAAPSAPATSQPAHAASRPTPVEFRPAVRRSARAALGEFFALSPAWLRVSSVAAALLLCALTAQTVLNLRPTAGSTHPPATPNDQAALAARLEGLTAERDAARRELEETRAQLDDSRAVNIEEAVLQETMTENEPEAQDTPGVRDAPRSRRSTPPARRGPAGQRGARGPRGDEDLPRLLDLLSDAN